MMPKRSYFNKHIFYLLKTKIISSWLRNVGPLLTFDTGGHTRHESTATGCSKATALASEAQSWGTRAGRDRAPSGFTWPWPTDSATLTQPAHCLRDLLDLNVISSSKPLSKCRERNQVSKTKYQLNPSLVFNEDSLNSLLRGFTLSRKNTKQTTHNRFDLKLSTSS